MDKTCSITFKGEGIEVVFDGEWIRRDVDASYYAMLKELPKYLIRRRSEDGKREEGRRKGTGRN